MTEPDTLLLCYTFVDIPFSFLYSRRYFMNTRGRATISWLPTSRPSRAKQFRTFWSPSCTRSTRGRSRASSWRSCSMLACFGNYSWCGRVTPMLCVWWLCLYRTVHRATPDSNKALCYLGVCEPLPLVSLSSSGLSNSLAAIWRGDSQAIHLHSKINVNRQAKDNVRKFQDDFLVVVSCAECRACDGLDVPGETRAHE